MLAGLQDWVDERHTAEVDETQERLTSDIIIPNAGVIEEQLNWIREVIDKRVEVKLERLAGFYEKRELVPGVFNLRRYPIGCCHLIRDEVLKVLGSAIGRSEVPCMTVLDEFGREGGVLKPAWGINQRGNGRFFQNVIQAGGYIFDPANDAEDFGGERVTHGRLDDFGFEDIESYQQYLDVVEPYWHVKAYPNVYFPDLAPVYPFLWIQADGILCFDSLSRSLVAMNVLSGGAEAENMIFESRIKDRRLPEEYLEMIGEEEASRERLAKSFDTFRHFLSIGKIDKSVLECTNEEVRDFNGRGLRV